MKKEKINKTLIYQTTIEGIDFNVYYTTICSHHCRVLAFQNEEVRTINITVDRDIDHDFYDSYFKVRLSTYQAIFKYLVQKNKHLKNWDEGPKIYNACDKYEAWKRQIIEEAERSEDADRLPDKNEIETVVKNERGHSFSSLFYCKLCKMKHSSGYSYLIRGHEVNVCSYCRTDIRRTNNYVKIIPTNMGHSKRG